MNKLLLIAALFSLPAMAADRAYTVPVTTTYTVPEGAFDDTITFNYSGQSGWGLIEIVANNTKVSCGRRCYITKPSLNFVSYNEETGVWLTDISGPGGSWAGLDVFDFTKQFCYQHSGHQLMLWSGWRLYLMPGTFTIRLSGIGLTKGASYWVSVRPASDDGCGN
jgi:hypothetical protein